MELFAAAGIDLPASGPGQRRPKPLSRTLHAPLFAHKVVEDAIAGGAPRLKDELRAVAHDYARKVKDPRFMKGKEMAVRGMFIQDVLQTVLGFTPYDPGHLFSLAIERQIGTGSVDVALGAFNKLEGPDEILAPFELKGPDTLDLDRVVPGRRRSPVEQAWDYANNTPESRWVLVSNCLEARLYAYGRGRVAYERFDLTRLDDDRELDRLWLLLGAPNLLGVQTDKLLRETDSAYRDITNELYVQYKGLRDRIVAFLGNRDEGPGLEPLTAIEVAQKLLDRILFIAFAQRTDLMQDKLLEKASVENNDFDPYPQWRNFQGLFRAVDEGRRNRRLDIPAYNGGLFEQDPLADTIVLPDHLAVEIAQLGEWDYRREVPVTVLGHLFEQSITDIEAQKALTRGEEPPAVSRRKREGVVYTPDMVTRFLVERTIGLSLEERRAALWAEHGMFEAPEGEAGPEPERAEGFWRAYMEALRGFTIVDPACGSGAFLVAAFDEMARRYRDAESGLAAAGVEIKFDVFDEIVTRNLHGVDLNAESVEITRLSLWLKTARRDHKLQNLEATIKTGDSLIEDGAFTERPFDWRAAFPQVFAAGGFDVVIGNPPYVRMEHLKAFKPYLAKHYAVADDRTDLYAYFFEQGVRVLKAGGRLGYISSSTFFKTGSGENLRTFLGDGVELEAVVDFGDVQLFEGVTTYPAILTLRKGGDGDDGELTFLGIKDRAPDDLGRAFARDGMAMPRARLGRGSWQFEGDALAALRAKITGGRKTLGEVYWPPLYGIKTGLNAAFVIDRETRERLVRADPKSGELLKAFLRGENIKRWRVEPEDLFLINTPKGKVDIEAYPAVRDWLAPFRKELEKRATKQAWWELQQAQLAYQSSFEGKKIVYQDITFSNPFTLDETGAFLANTCYFIPSADRPLLALLNSRLAWFFLTAVTNIARGGYLRLRTEFVEQLPVPEIGKGARKRLQREAQLCTDAAAERLAVQRAVRRRILDLAPPEHRRLSARLEAWHELDFAGFLREARKAFRAEIPLKRRGEWEAYLSEEGAKVRRLSDQIAAAEREIDAVVYRLFGLTPDEITLLETSLAGQY